MVFKSVLSHFVIFASALLIRGPFAFSAPVAPTLVSQQAWEVAVIMLSKGEPEDFQSDFDKNVMELARTCSDCDSPNRVGIYNLSIARDFQKSITTYFNKTELKNENPIWDVLFAKTPLAGLQIPGQIKTYELFGKSIFDNAQALKEFFSKSFAKENAKRILVIYGHGEGYRGLRVKQIKTLQKLLAQNIPARVGAKALDILWFDSCFMASTEAVWQLQDLSDYMIGSQDAEFSSAMPFDSLSLLEEGPADVKSVAVSLAKRFVESYSILKKGSQQGSVETSAATISLVQTNLLSPLIQGLAALWKDLKSLPLEDLKKNLSAIQMQQTELVDLGGFLRQSNRLLSLQNQNLKQLKNLLEVDKVSQLRSNSRLYLQAPIPDSWLVVGYNDWSSGFEGDADHFESLQQLLQTQDLFDGPDLKKWPAKKIHHRFLQTLFIPGVEKVNYYWADAEGNPLSDPMQAVQSRQVDFFERIAVSAQNPLIYSASTQSVGDFSERYTGLNIVDPTNGTPDIDYLDLDFNRQTGWSNSMQ